MSFNRGKKLNLNDQKDKLIIGLLLLSIFLGAFNSCSKEKEFVLTNGKSSESPEMEAFCNAFIDQIINKSLHKEMVENDIYLILIDENYKVLNLVGDEKRLYSRSQSDECSVIVKDQLGLRRFDIRVNKSTDYPFYYRVQRIDEPKVEG